MTKESGAWIESGTQTDEAQSSSSGLDAPCVFRLVVFRALRLAERRIGAVQNARETTCLLGKHHHAAERSLCVV
jgi:hypothetical protein|tara:strand:+ start:318 stop:539 length:222 start_codon:yes stop_codon:yes gene_type:complete